MLFRIECYKLTQLWYYYFHPHYSLPWEDYVGRAWLRCLARVSRIHAYRIHPPIVPVVSIVGRKPYRLPKGPVLQERNHPPQICCFHQCLPIVSPELYTGSYSRLCTKLISFPTTMRIEERCMKMIMPYVLNNLSHISPVQCIAGTKTFYAGISLNQCSFYYVSWSNNITAYVCGSI